MPKRGLPVKSVSQSVRQTDGQG